MTDFSSPSSEGTPPACLPPHLRKPRLRRTEAIEYLSLVWGIDLKSSTLASMLSDGTGPGFQKNGPTPLYPRTELDKWAEQRLGPVRYSSSEA